MKKLTVSNKQYPQFSTTRVYKEITHAHIKSSINQLEDETPLNKLPPSKISGYTISISDIA